MKLGFLFVTMVFVVLGSNPDRIIVVHRHGARTPIVSVNTTAICKPHGKCGSLTSNDKDMLYHLGRYLRENYNTTITPYSYYDPEGSIVSRSTDTPRTIQSATEMIKGLFAHLIKTDVNHETNPSPLEDSLLDPVVSTVPLDRDDLLLVWTGLPSLVLMQAVWNNDFFATMQNQTLKLLSLAKLRQLGAEVGPSEECDLQAHPQTFNAFNCALDLQDFWNCNRAEGFAASYPLLAKYGPGVLTQVLEEYNSWSEWIFDDNKYNGNFIRDAGTLGFQLATKIINDAKQPTEGSPSVFHYSGHDTTLMPLWQTLGNLTLLNPGFGAAMIFEVYSGEANKTIIKAKIGEPGQLPDDHTYRFDEYQMLCTRMESVGGAVTYTSASCPLEDFERFIQGRGPTSVLGKCFANASMLAAVQCTPEERGPLKKKLTQACKVFRQACPITACGDENFITSSLECDPRVLNVDHEHHHTGKKEHEHITVAILSGAVAVLAVVVVALLWSRSKQQTHDNGEYMSVS